MTRFQIMHKNKQQTIRWFNHMADIPQAQWDRLAVPLDTPLLEWQWLHQLEASGSIAPSEGWHPCHLTVWKKDNLVAAAPLYIKTHSFGEFIFDHGWAHLADQLGVAYYPKLVGMSPATPAVGYRFLMDPELDPTDQERLLNKMVDAMDELCRRLGLSGSHLHFVDPRYRQIFHSGRFISWQHQSYLWRNAGYKTFADYLQRFNTNQRRNIRRECRRMAQQDVQIRPVQGNEIPSHWSRLMYACYLDTNQRYGLWAAKYLNADFFDRLFHRHRERLLVMAAYQNSGRKDPIALSLLMVKGRQLLGRYWGTTRWIKDLHFNLCFYAPIRWAIEHRIAFFDPGAGSSHKIYRGFEAVTNTSLHRFYHPRLQGLFKHLIVEVNQMEQSNVDDLNAHLPFARHEDAGAHRAGAESQAGLSGSRES